MNEAGMRALAALAGSTNAAIGNHNQSLMEDGRKMAIDRLDRGAFLDYIRRERGKQSRFSPSDPPPPPPPPRREPMYTAQSDRIFSENDRRIPIPQLDDDDVPAEIPQNYRPAVTELSFAEIQLQRIADYLQTIAMLMLENNGSNPTKPDPLLAAQLESQQKKEIDLGEVPDFVMPSFGEVFGDKQNPSAQESQNDSQNEEPAVKPEEK